jgi:hypothetical protein
MGTPIPDDFAAPLGLFEVEEAGDGRLDIYLVNGSNQSYGRPLAIRQAAPAMAPSAPEYRGTASSGYIVMDVLQNRKPHELESTLAHEFFHVLQFRHEVRGIQSCPYPSVAAASTCRAAEQSFHWFVEASASWAEHEFVPAGRPVAAYERFGRFLGTESSLAQTDGENEYLSFMWPLFMEQEDPQGPESIAAAWRAIEGKSGWTAVQAAVDAQLSFETKFRDFAVRLWNEQLLPGDPIQPRFNDPRLDRYFPTTTPEQADPHLRYVDDIQLVLSELHRERVEIAELSVKYYRVDIPPGAGRLTLTFSGLTPNDKLDVDALVEVHPEGWSRRELDPATTEWCLDKPGEAVERAILVLSNHSQTPDEHITGEWSVIAEAGGCQQVGDGLVFTSVREFGLPSDDVFATTTETLTLRMSLKSSSTGFGFEDDGGSTYHATMDSNGTIKGLPGCDTITEAHGAASGPLPDPKAINVSVVNGVMSVAASFPVRVQSSMTSCGGSSSSVSEYTVQLPPCDGLEIPGAAGVLTYEFACVGSTPGWSWRLSGTVQLRI